MKMLRQFIREELNEGSEDRLFARAQSYTYMIQEAYQEWNEGFGNSHRAQKKMRLAASKLAALLEDA